MEPTNIPENSGLSINPATELVSLPSGSTPALSEIINRSLVHIKTSRKLNNLDPRPGAEREFEIAPGVKIVMCWIPPGEFWMGSPSDEVGRLQNEAQHLVKITDGFWLAKTQITQAQWQAVMGGNPSRFKGEYLPVERVSWDDICGNETDALGFIQVINRLSNSGGHFHLPTEAQWEYACRAGTSGPHYGKLDDIAWHYSISGRKTHPVGLKKPNAWGLHDMLGNVYEWCSDWLGDYPIGVATDPNGPVLGAYRVIRGGSWTGTTKNYWRVADRGGMTPSYTDQDHIGFRLARSTKPING